MARAFALSWRPSWRSSHPLAPRLAAMVVWAVLAATAVFWALRLLVSGAPVPAQVRTVTMTQSVQGDAMRLFGPPRTVAAAAAAAPSPASTRFKLYGVVAGVHDDAGRAGVVTLGVDGGPPRAYRVGDAVDAQWQVQSIGRDVVRVGPASGAAGVSLDVPALAAPGEPGPGAANRLPQDGTPPMPPLSPPGGDMPAPMMEPPAAGMARPANPVEATPLRPPGMGAATPRP